MSQIEQLRLVAKQALFDAVVADVGEAGRSVGIRALVLKGAWADPVLFGGKGQRLKGDVDVLVRPRDFRAYARALVKAGYRYSPQSTHRATNRWGSKEWGFTKGCLPPIDLHWGLADEPWFKWPAEDAIDRAIDYPSALGPVYSLCPEDQVLYAAAHYANHRYRLDQAHFRDTLALLKLFQVDWHAVRSRAHRFGLSTPLWLFEKSLKAAGVTSIPPHNIRGFEGARAALALRWVATNPLQRKPGTTWHLDKFTRLPLLSSRPSAFVEFAARTACLTTLDQILRRWPNLTWDDPRLGTD